jgi:Ca2+-binding EF-hand superfamily protein
MLRMLIAGAALAALASPVLAQPAGPPPDGARRLFISPAGEPFRSEDGLAAWFAGADANHDGALTLSEFRDDFMRFFKVLDSDGDGQVDGPENTVYETKIAPEITRMAFDRGPGAGGPPGGKPRIIRKADRSEPRSGAARFSLLNIPQPVRGADADLNQRVSADEWARAARQRFELLDADKDDKLTLEGLKPRARR